MEAKRPVPAVSALIVENGKVLLVKRGCEPNKGLWSLPGGSIGLGETVADALVREVAEETGLQIEVDGVAGVRDVMAMDGGEIAFHYVVVTLRARVVGGMLQPGTDAADAGWFAPEQIAGLETTPGLAEHIASPLASTSP